MDSLLLVLTVVGVVMVLVGVARMKSKRSQSWDEVDHSVLFDKDGQPTTGADKVVMDGDLSEAKIAEELSQLSSQISAQSDAQGSAPENANPASGKKAQREVNESVIVEPSMQNPPTKKPAAVTSPKLSFFDKIIGDKQSEKNEALDGVYRKGAQEWVVVLNVMALDGEVFTGPGFFYALEDNGWNHGEMDIYHYRDNGVPLFSLVNMVKPGTFDPSAIDKFRSPGVSLFIQFPNDHGNGLRTFNMMLDMAQILADRLGGEVRDERRSVLTHSAIDHMREKIAAYDLKWQLPK